MGLVRKSSKRPTFGDCLRELGRLIQQDHDPSGVVAAHKLQVDEKDAADTSTKHSHDEGAVSLNANQVLMLHSMLKIMQARAAQVNKSALETEKQMDEFHVSWSGWVDCILVLRGRCSVSLHTGGVDEDARSHGARQ